MREKWNSMDVLYLSVIVLGIPALFLDNNIKAYNNLNSNKREIFVNLFENKKICLENLLDKKCFDVKFREYNIRTNLVDYSVDGIEINSPLNVESGINVNRIEMYVNPYSVVLNENNKYKLNFKIKY